MFGGGEVVDKISQVLTAVSIFCSKKRGSGFRRVAVPCRPFLRTLYVYNKCSIGKTTVGKRV